MRSLRKRWMSGWKGEWKSDLFPFFPFFLALLEILLMLDITKASFVLFSRNRKIPYFPSVFL